MLRHFDQMPSLSRLWYVQHDCDNDYQETHRTNTTNSLYTIETAVNITGVWWDLLSKRLIQQQSGM